MGQPFAAFQTEQVAIILGDQIGMQNGLYPPLRPNDLSQHSHALGNLPPPDRRSIVGYPYFRQQAAGMELR